MKQWSLTIDDLIIKRLRTIKQGIGYPIGLYSFIKWCQRRGFVLQSGTNVIILSKQEAARVIFNEWSK